MVFSVCLAQTKGERVLSDVLGETVKCQLFGFGYMDETQKLFLQRKREIYLLNLLVP